MCCNKYLLGSLPGKRGTTQVTPAQLSKTISVAKVCILVEKVTQHLKHSEHWNDSQKQFFHKQKEK